MQSEKISLRDTRSFSPFFLDYINGADVLKPFYQQFPAPENFGKQIAGKSSFSSVSRKVLSDVLSKQYGTLPAAVHVKENITSLESPKTFTITTGHQLNIFTGPLYFIFKIVTVINTCRLLREKYPENNFVPVYWMASEDHDFEEISYFRLYGKKYTWETKQTGAVGRFNPGSLKELLNALPGDNTIFREAYLKNTTLSAAVRSYVNALFGHEGLVVIDADDPVLKSQLKGVMMADLFNHEPRQFIDNDTARLKELGYHTQVNAREINFFLLQNNRRDRIEKDGEGFKIVDREIHWTRDEATKLIENSPELFSPNVCLRPLYQEIILPNLAYVGGPSELVYWLQLNSMFTHFNVPFPILMPRNFGMVMDASLVRKFEKTKLEVKDLFEEKNFLFNHWTLKNSGHELSLGTMLDKTRMIFDSIREQAGKIDSTLTAHADAKGKQTLRQIEAIEKKMLKAEKRNLEDKLAQLGSIKDILFPGGSLQERTDNFLNFYQSNPKFIDDLIHTFDPFDYQLTVLKYHD